MEIMKYSPHVYRFNTVFTLFTHPMKEFNTDASISSFPCMSLKFSVYNNITFYTSAKEISLQATKPMNKLNSILH